jgi:predicted dithiol-disulfide oxidoreductase (DUF899 family)
LGTTDLGDLTNLHERDTSLAFVSRVSSEEIAAAKQERGCTMPCYSVEGAIFNAATGYADVARLSVFIHHDSVFLTYVTQQGRDLETISNL